MALLNNIYIFVKKESVSGDMNITQHPVEKGIPTTDTVRRNPTTLSIDGKIVDVGKTDADTIISKIENLKVNGSLVKYVGRKKVGNFQIKSFNYEFSNETWGGADFSMELVEVRIAKSAYNKKKTTTTQKKTQTAAKKNNPVLKVGSIVVFKGGSVYVSSDAKKASATRGRSTCKITNINTKSWAKHQYHLISTDGKKVYGWVDKSKIEGTGNSGTGAVTNGGTQQVKKK